LIKKNALDFKNFAIVDAQVYPKNKNFEPLMLLSGENKFGTH